MPKSILRIANSNGMGDMRAREPHRRLGNLPVNDCDDIGKGLGEVLLANA